MRLFKLIKGGEEFDLTARRQFMANPDGLGFSVSFQRAQAGLEYIDLGEALEPKEISGEIVFDGYERYQEFARFVTGAALQLAYKPTNKWYYIDVKAQSLGKTELQPNGRLFCPVSFSAFSPWYEAEEIIESVVGGGKAKKYNYKYNYQYARQDIIGCNVENVQAESPCRLAIYGPAVDPYWTVNQGNKQLTTGRVNVTLSAGQKLVIDSRAESMEIAIYTAATDEFVNDAYRLSDFDTERFVYLPVGNSSVTIQGADHAILEVNKYAYTV